MCVASNVHQSIDSFPSLAQSKLLIFDFKHSGCAVRGHDHRQRLVMTGELDTSMNRLSNCSVDKRLDSFDLQAGKK